MKTKLLILVALVAIPTIIYLMTSWMSSNKRKRQNSIEAIMDIIQEKSMELDLDTLEKELKPLIPVGEESFTKIVAHIKLYGDKEKGYTLLTFTDRNGNNHKMVITTKEDDFNNELAAQDSIRQVSVLMHYDKIVDKKQTLVYAITKKEARPALQKDIADEKHVQAVKEAYEDFLLFIDQD